MSESERFGAGEFTDPALLPGPQYRLHRAQQRAIRAEREQRLRAKDLDESGRAWRGLRKPKRNTNP